MVQRHLQWIALLSVLAHSSATRAAPADPPAPAPATAAVKGEIRGRVNGPDGRPLPGARVVAQAHDRTWRGWRDEGLDSALETTPELPAEVLGSATTDAAGTFTFTGLVPHREYRLVATGDGPLAPEVGIVVALPRASEVVTLEVREGRPLQLQLVGADGRTAPGNVDVRLHAPSHALGAPVQARGERWAIEGIPSELDGRVEIPAVPDGACEVVARIPGQGQISWPLLTPYEGRLTLSLGDAANARLEGVVRDEEGRPVPGARLAWDTGWHAAQRRLRLTTSDTHGRFAVAGLPAGSLRLASVAAQGLVLQEAEEMRWSRIVAAAQQTIRGDVLLEPACSVVGRVSDATGAPVVDAVVLLEPEHSGTKVRTRTSRAGTYEFTGLRPSRTFVTVLGLEPDGPSPVPQDAFDTGARAMINLAPAGTTRTQDFRVRRSTMPSLRGTVLKPDGSPAAGALVTATRGLTTPELTPAASVVTDAEGHFEILPPAPYPNWELIARVEDLRARKITTLSEDMRIVLQLAAGYLTKVAGRVVSADGVPLANATVAPAVEPMFVCGAYSGPSEVGPSTTTDLDGRFALEFDLDQHAEFTLFLVHRGLPLHPVHNGQLFSQPDGLRWHSRHGKEDLSDLTLTALPTGEIAGVVVNEQGQPIPRAHVDISPVESGIGALRGVTVATDAAGRFRAPHLIAGRHKVSSGEAEGAPSAIVATGTLDVKLVRCQPPPRKASMRVQGMLLGPDGAPVRSGQLSFTHGAEVVRGTPIVVDGAFDLEVTVVIEPARIYVDSAFDRKGNQLVMMALEAGLLADAAVGPITIRVPPRPALMGRVVDAAGNGIAGTLVHVASEDAWREAFFKGEPNGPWTVTGEDGAFHLAMDGWTQGRLHVVPKGLWVRPAVVEVAPSEDPRAIVLSRGAAIEGTCLDASGAPVSAQVSAEWSHPEPGATPAIETEADGRFQLVVPVGAQGVTLRADEGPGMPMRVRGMPFAILRDVEVGRTDLRLRLTRGDTVAGVVVGPSGEPVLSGWVIALDDPDAGRAARPEGLPELPFPVGGPAAVALREGRFELGGLAAGTSRIFVLPEGDTFAPSDVVEVQVPSSDVIVRVPRSVEVKLALQGGASSGWFATWAGTSPDGKPYWRWCESDDVGVLRLLVPPTKAGLLYVRHVEDDRYALVERLSAAEPGPQELALHAGLSIEGHVEGVAAEGVEGSLVRLRGQGIVTSTWLQPGARFRARGLPAGRYEIEVEIPGAATMTTSEALPVVEAGTKDVVVRSGIRYVQRR